MPSEVWLHYAHAGASSFWYVTSDGLHVIDRVAEIALRDARFIIDPIGQERARRLNRRVTHAWAVGTWEVGTPFEADDQPFVTRVSYQWWRSTEFTMDDRPVRGAAMLFLGREPDGAPVAYGYSPRFGITERANVQQYGRER